MSIPGNGQDLVEVIHGLPLFDHHRDDHVTQRLHVVRMLAAAEPEGAAGLRSQSTAVGRGFGPNAADRGSRVVRGADVGEQDAVEAGVDRPRGGEVPQGGVHLDHRAHVREQLDRPADPVQVVQVERRLLRDELDVVESAAPAHELVDRRPGTDDVRAERGFAGPQELAQVVVPHVTPSAFESWRECPAPCRKEAGRCARPFALASPGS